jgi:hypothetical protein
MKRSIITTLIISILATYRVSAQNGYSALIKSGPGDATKLIDAYAQPIFKGFGVGMNSGWSNTAKTKKTLKFDLRISASVAFVPSSEKNFDVTALGLSNNVRVKPGSSNFTPTIGGGNNPTTLETFDDNGNKVDEFVLPTGKTSVIPAPQIQVTVGLIQNTDLTLRAIPKINFGNDVGSVSMIGLGVKHNIMADFAKTDAVVPFDLAIAFGFNRLNMKAPLNVKPDADALPAPGNTTNNFENQYIEGHFNSFMLQAIVSKKYKVITPFLSVGYNTSKTDVAAIGNYPISTNTAVENIKFYQTFTNPIHINKKSIDGMRADIGFQLELGYFRFYTSYSAAQYQSVNAGIGFGL